MSVYRVLDKLESYVHEGTWLPAGYRVLSEERLLELIEKVRASLPEEVGRAKIIAKDQDRVMREAQQKAQSIVDEASSKHEELVDRHEIAQRARTTADVVLREAQERADRIRRGADEYASGVLTEMENRLSGALGAVRKGRDSLARTAASAQAPAEAPLADAAAQSKRSAFDSQHAAEETAELEPVQT